MGFASRHVARMKLTEGTALGEESSRSHFSRGLDRSGWGKRAGILPRDTAKCRRCGGSSSVTPNTRECDTQRYRTEHREVTCLLSGESRNWYRPRVTCVLDGNHQDQDYPLDKSSVICDDVCMVTLTTSSSWVSPSRMLSTFGEYPVLSKQVAFALESASTALSFASHPSWRLL